MSASIQPFLRTPLTDFAGCLLNHQHYGKCAQFEMNMVECMEAYGIPHGYKKCADLMDDFKECVNENKSAYRVFAMEMERRRQVREGERKEKYCPPPRMDAF